MKLKISSKNNGDIEITPLTKNETFYKSEIIAVTECLLEMLKDKWNKVVLGGIEDPSHFESFFVREVIDRLEDGVFELVNDFEEDEAYIKYLKSKRAYGKQ